jgi:hypothetical protein
MSGDRLVVKKNYGFVERIPTEIIINGKKSDILICYLNKQDKLLFSKNFSKIHDIQLDGLQEIINPPRKEEQFYIFSFGGPFQSKFLEKLFNLNLCLNCFSCGRYILGRCSGYLDDFMMLTQLSEYVRRFVNMKYNFPVSFGGFCLINNMEKQLYLIQSQNEIDFDSFCKSLNGGEKDKLIAFVTETNLSADFVLFLLKKIIKLRYFLIQPYLKNYTKVYNFLGFTKYDVSESIYKNSGLNTKLKVFDFLKKELAQKNNEFLLKHHDSRRFMDEKLDSNKVRYARRILWKIMSEMQNWNLL